MSVSLPPSMVNLSPFLSPDLYYSIISTNVSLLKLAIEGTFPLLLTVAISSMTRTTFVFNQFGIICKSIRQEKLAEINKESTRQFV